MSNASVTEYLYLPDGVLKDRGGLTIKTSATLAVYLTDALQYLFSYPYGCSEQLASKLSAIAIGKRALSLPNVAQKFTFPTVTFNGTEYTVDQAVSIGLTQIYDNQTPSGGFSYYKGLPESPYLTSAVLDSLLEVKKAGYIVRQSVIDDALNYLASEAPVMRQNGNADSLIYAAYVMKRGGRGNPFAGDIEAIATTQYLSDSASSNTLGYLAILSAEGGMSDAFKQKVFATLLNRVDIDSRGAYVKPNAHNFGWMYYETTEKDTALLLKALVTDKREYPETGNLLRWLLASRSVDGAWGSTNTSVATIDALADYLSWKRETESSFSLATLLDGDTVSKTDFTKDNILSSVQTFLPVSGIALGAMHTLSFEKTNNNTLPNNFYYDLSLKYYLPANQIAPRDEGVAITREFYSLTDVNEEHPLSSAKVGDIVKGVLTIVSPKERHLFAIEDYIPAGFELVNFNLATEDQTSETQDYGVNKTNAPVAHAGGTTSGFSLANFFSAFLSAFGWRTNDVALPEDIFDPSIAYQKFYPDFQELHDDRLFLFSEDVAPGTYRYEYFVRATTPGTFNHLPAVASDLYFPENFGRTSGSLFTVEE
jgi:uncharacterized protein YfaS (alpha-2-macroglobulin family)